MTEPYKMYSMHVNTSKESWVVYFMQMTETVAGVRDTTFHQQTNRPSADSKYTHLLFHKSGGKMRKTTFKRGSRA